MEKKAALRQWLWQAFEWGIMMAVITKKIEVRGMSVEEAVEEFERGPRCT